MSKRRIFTILKYTESHFQKPFQRMNKNGAFSFDNTVDLEIN